MNLRNQHQYTKEKVSRFECIENSLLKAFKIVRQAFIIFSHYHCSSGFDLPKLCLVSLLSSSRNSPPKEQ